MPRPLVEIHRVTQGVVLEIHVLAPAPAPAPVPIEPPDERLPPGAGHQLRPLADLHHRADASLPQGVAGGGDLRRACPLRLPPCHSDGWGGGGALAPVEAREAEAAAAAASEECL